jgi:hypothetical protein
MIRADAAAAGAVLVFAAAAVFEASRLPFGTLRSPGPGFLPVWAGAVLGLLAVALLARALTTRVAGDGGGGAGRGLLKVAGLLVALAVYVGLVEPLGYPACTVLLVLFMLRVVDRHRWPVALGVAALAGFGSYVVFAVWLGVPLPPGPFAR